MGTRTKVGIVGCGAISPAYFRGMQPYAGVEIAACADMDVARAEARAKEFNVPKAYSVDDLLRDPSIELVLNLTVPKSHAEVNHKALEAGKHAYCEKPFAVTRADGEKVLATAKRKKLRVGCAPDTFLGAGIQTARRLLDEGVIGRPVAATAFMVSHGPESWHPNPFFYYEVGGGPMFDMGPYYLTALVNLLGPVRRVTGSAQVSFAERTATSEMHRGKKIKVETPTHVTGVMDFSGGAVGTIIMSFDVWAHRLPIIEIYGSEGSMVVPDPNKFDGAVLVRLAGEKEWKEMPHTHRTDVARGSGVADMARGIQTGRAHRANGELAYHVLDIMSAFEEASKAGRHVELNSSCERPAALPAGLQLGELD